MNCLKWRSQIYLSTTFHYISIPPTLPSLPLGRPNDVDCRPAYFVLCMFVAAVAVAVRTEVVVVVVVVVEVAAGDGPGRSDGVDCTAAAASVAADAATVIRLQSCSS